jgi:TPR repeat protein
MRLLPQWGSGQAEEAAALQQRVNALRSALNSCKGVARTCAHYHYTTLAAAVAVGLTVGFVLGVYREPLAHSARSLTATIGLATAPFEKAQAAYRQGDLAAAERLAGPLAEEGDARAQSLLGLIHLRRRGGPQEDAEAVAWLRRAAEQGDASAQFGLGVMSEEGRGLPKEPAEAMRWYRLAAERGHAPAQYNLGLWYSKGGEEHDDVSAHMWLNLAAARFGPTDDRYRAAAIRNRDMVEGRMTAEQVAQARQRARDWTPK